MLSSWPRAFLHLDGDAFFASCEQSLHPELKGRPVVTGQERNIVASLSYEAKARGIRRATPIWEARKICPEVVILPSDYESYSLISKRMFAIMRRFTPEVEESSIDEGLASLDGLRRTFRMGYPEIARRMQAEIEKELDIPVSAGLSVTRLLAKLASKFRKPRGFTVVPGREIHRFLAQIPVQEVMGIGPNTTAFLRKKGIRTAWEYVRQPETTVRQWLGKVGHEIWRELRGEPVYALNPEAKTSYDSISKGKTFTPPSSDFMYLKAQLFRNAESAFIKLRRYHLRARRIVVCLRRQDFRSAAMEGALNRGTISPQEAFGLIQSMLERLYEPDTLYRYTGIVLSAIEEDHGRQWDLFEDPLRVLRMERLAREVDEINGLFGKHTIHSGIGLFLKINAAGRNPALHGRHALPGRKEALLAGETFRQRLNIPLWAVRV